ncbi:hypothetical protein Tco_0943685 [Tanacetum coccineum]
MEVGGPCITHGHVLHKTPGELIPFAIPYLDHHRFLSLYPFGKKVMLVLIGSRIQIEDKGSINRPLNHDLWFYFVSSGLLQFGSTCEVFSFASDFQAAADEDDDNDVDLFGEETEEEKKAAEEHAAAVKASGKKKESNRRRKKITGNDSGNHSKRTEDNDLGNRSRKRSQRFRESFPEEDTNDSGFSFQEKGRPEFALIACRRKKEGSRSGFYLGIEKESSLSFGNKNQSLALIDVYKKEKGKQKRFYFGDRKKKQF